MPHFENTLVIIRCHSDCGQLMESRALTNTVKTTCWPIVRSHTTQRHSEPLSRQRDWVRLSPDLTPALCPPGQLYSPAWQTRAPGGRCASRGVFDLESLGESFFEL